MQPLDRLGLAGRFEGEVAFGTAGLSARASQGEDLSDLRGGLQHDDLLASRSVIEVIVCPIASTSVRPSSLSCAG